LHKLQIKRRKLTQSDDEILNNEDKIMSFYKTNLFKLGTAIVLALGVTAVGSYKASALGLEDILSSVIQKGGLSVNPDVNILEDAQGNTIQVCVVLTCQPSTSIPSILGIPNTTANTTNRTTTVPTATTVPTTTTIPTATTTIPNTNGTVVRTTTTNTNGVPSSNTTVNGVPVNTSNGTVYGTTANGTVYR
jgi:hypothetical protein